MKLYVGLILSVCLVMTFLLTFFIIRFSKKRNLVANPVLRSLHQVPTAQIGGISILISWFGGIISLYLLDMIDKKLFFSLCCGIPIAIVSLIDDLHNVRPSIRLIIHFFSSIAAFYFLKGLRPLIIPEININYDFISYPLAVVGMVWCINFFNFMDGVDGYVSIESIIVSLILFFFTLNYAPLVLMACVAGFLCWNWPKAKIFMGDTGSTQLGFIIVVLGIYFHNEFKFSILNWVMLLSPFWFDATFTLIRRWIRRERLSEAHRKHVYQRLVLAGYSHLSVNFLLIVLNLLIISMILLYREYKILQAPLFCLSLLLFYYITRLVDKKVPF